MNILEAIKTGKRLKRARWFGGYFTWEQLGRYPNFHDNVEHITATDWVVRDETFEITSLELSKMSFDLHNNFDTNIDEAISNLKEGKYK